MDHTGRLASLLAIGQFLSRRKMIVDKELYLLCPI